MQNNQEVYGNMSAVECAKMMVEIKRKIDNFKEEVLRPLQSEHDYLKFVGIPEKMDDMGVTTITIKDLGRLTVSETISASTIKEKRADLWNWLKETGNDGLITDTVNSSTLSAFVREAMREGHELPDDCLNITAKQTASITKS